MRHVTLAAVALAALSLAPPRGQPLTAGDKAGPPRPPSITAGELKRRLAAPGFDPAEFVAREIEFRGAVEITRAVPLVRIQGLGPPGGFDRAHLYHLPEDHKLKVGDEVTVRGLVVEHGFGAWMVWVYDWKRGAAAAGPAPPAPDTFAGEYVELPILSGGGGRRFTITRDGDAYRLDGREPGGRNAYAGYKFVRKGDGRLADERGSLGTITAGRMAFEDGKETPVLRVNFCYEHFLLVPRDRPGLGN